MTIYAPASVIGHKRGWSDFDWGFRGISLSFKMPIKWWIVIPLRSILNVEEHYGEDYGGWESRHVC